jgi:hypothetical protein
MTEAIQLAEHSITRGRQTKFTPERLRQITNLVERGKTREEIAEIIGVTPATLQVTCSRLKISLRRPIFNTGTGLLRRQRPRSNNGSHSLAFQEHKDRNNDEMKEAEPPLESAAVNGFIAELHPGHEGYRKEKEPSARPQFGLRMQYKGEDKTIDLSFSPEMIGRLAIEAEFRNVRVGELITHLIQAVIERDQFQAVLKPDLSKLPHV